MNVDQIMGLADAFAIAHADAREERLLDTVNTYLIDHARKAKAALESAVVDVLKNVERLTAERDALRADAARYRWIREHPAWESECFLNGLTPDEFDAALENTMRIWNDQPSAP